MAKTRQKSSFSKHFTTITPLSMTIAFLLFIALPFIGFYLGMQYQKTVDTVTSSAPAAISGY